MEGGYGRFDGYYAKYKEYVTKNLMKLTKGDKQLTEDLSQEVWLAFYREMDQVIPIGDDGIRGWLYMVGRRKFLDNMDLDYRSREMFAEDMKIDEKAPDDTVAVRRRRNISGDTEDVILTRLMFEEYIAELTGTERILVLCKLCGIPPRDALPDLDCTDVAIRVRVSRAMKKLRDYLEG